MNIWKRAVLADRKTGRHLVSLLEDTKLYWRFFKNSGQTCWTDLHLIGIFFFFISYDKNPRRLVSLPWCMCGGLGGGAVCRVLSGHLQREAGLWVTPYLEFYLHYQISLHVFFLCDYGGEKLKCVYYSAKYLWWWDTKCLISFWEWELVELQTPSGQREEIHNSGDQSHWVTRHKWVFVWGALLNNTGIVPSRVPASHEQNAEDHGTRRGHLHQRLCDHTHVLPLPVLHAHREVRAQPQRLHQQRELLFTFLAGDARTSDFCCVS